jgi:hypothetical protein
MATKATKKRQKREFWERQPNIVIIKKVLQDLGVSLSEFKAKYLASCGTKGKVTTPEEVKAVEQWQKTGDYEALKKKLEEVSGIKSPIAVNNCIVRAMELKAKGKS